MSVSVLDEASYDIVRHMAKHGMLVGLSGAAAVWGALQVAEKLEQGIVVTIIPDSGIVICPTRICGRKDELTVPEPELRKLHAMPKISP